MKNSNQKFDTISSVLESTKNSVHLAGFKKSSNLTNQNNPNKHSKGSLSPGFIKSIANYFCFILIFFSVFPSPAFAQTPPQSNLVQIVFDTFNATQQYYELKEPEAIISDQFFRKYGPQIGYSSKHSFKLIESDTSYAKFKILFNNIPVFGQEYFLHYKEGKLISANGFILQNLKANNDGNILITSDAALNKAINYVDHQIKNWLQFNDSIKGYNLSYLPKNKPVIELCYIFKKGSNVKSASSYRLAYQIEIYHFKQEKSTKVFVDAETGKIVNEFPLTFICHAISGQTAYNGTQGVSGNFASNWYYLYNNCYSSRGDVHTMYRSGSNLYDYVSSTNSFGSTNIPGIQSHYVGIMARDYFYFTFGRNSYNNASSMISINNNEIISGSSYNASYSNGTISIGAGNGNNNSYYNTNDILSHEFVHGVTFTSAGLIYQGESGALNEAFSDIFGNTIENYIEGSVNWLLGEDRSGGAFRSMSNPKLYNQPNTKNRQNWADPTDLSNDYGGVHTNSGPLNLFFKLLASGGSGTNDNGYSYNISGIGLSSAAAICYRALTQYLSSTSVYGDARNAMLSAASSLYGSSSTQYNTVSACFCAIGIGSSCSGSSSPDLIINNLNVSPASIGTNGSITISFDVKNIGSANAPASITRIRINQNSSAPYTSDYLIQEYSTNSLAPGASQSFVKNFSLNTQFGAGTWYIWVSADCGNNIGQTNYGNDRAKQAITITATQPCTYSLNNYSQNFSSSSGSGNFYVTTQGNCNVNPFSSDSWITIISSGFSGSGNVAFVVSENLNTSSRTGTINISDQTFTIIQSGQAGQPCKYSISPKSENFLFAGGQSYALVTTGGTCLWNAVTSDNWIIITTASGTGINYMEYQVMANNSSSPRIGSINIMGETYTIFQDGQNCPVAVYPKTDNISYPAGNYTFNFSTGNGCGYSVRTSDPSWLKITNVLTENTVNYSVAANLTGQTRYGIITVDTVMHFIIQNSKENSLNDELNNNKGIIYPNPVKPGNNLKVSNSVSVNNIHLISLDGKLYHQTFLSNIISIPENIVPGTYLLRILDKTGKTSNQLLLIE